MKAEIKNAIKEAHKEKPGIILSAEDIYNAIYQAGIWEVVGWMQSYGRFNENSYDEYWGYFCIEPEDYEAKLKEWGIK